MLTSIMGLSAPCIIPRFVSPLTLTEFQNICCGTMITLERCLSSVNPFDIVCVESVGEITTFLAGNKPTFFIPSLQVILSSVMCVSILSMQT